MGPRAGRVPHITAALLTSATLLALSACADGAANSAGVWVRVSPASTSAGSQIQITAVCEQQTVTSATVTSTAFGSVTMQSASTSLSATVVIPPSTPKGAFDVRLTCPSGSMASTTLMVTTGQAQASASNAPGPNTGGGFLAHEGDADDAGQADRAENGQPAGRAPLLLVGAGLASMLAAAALTVRSRKAALTVRSKTHSAHIDHDQAVEPGPRD